MTKAALIKTFAKLDLQSSERNVRLPYLVRNEKSVVLMNHKKYTGRQLYGDQERCAFARIDDSIIGDASSLKIALANCVTREILIARQHA